jgi:hypothetical protein
MTHAYSSDGPREFSPGAVCFPAPTAAALTSPIAADAWFDQALQDADEPIYHPAPGMPRRGANDAMVFAMARSAKPESKIWIQTVFQRSGRLRYISNDRPIPGSAERLLKRLVALLDRESCAKGWFHVKACNHTLAHELETSARSIQRDLATLQTAGFIYRHYTTGEIGLKRKSIDLGPLVYRLDELNQDTKRKAAERQELRELRNRSVTFPDVRGNQTIAGGDDNAVALNTDDSESFCISVSAQGEDAVEKTGAACPDPTRQAANPKQLPLPKHPPNPDLVVQISPCINAYVGASPKTWPAVINAAYAISSTWQLNRTTWGALCAHLGRDWAAIAVAIVAELPESRFTPSKTLTLAQQRARYLAGIVRKIARQQDVNIAASWYRLVKLRQAEGLAGRTR